MPSGARRLKRTFLEAGWAGRAGPSCGWGVGVAAEGPSGVMTGCRRVGLGVMIDVSVSLSLSSGGGKREGGREREREIG